MWHCMHTFRLIHLFRVTTIIALHVLVFKKTHQYSHTVQGCNTVSPLCLKRSVLAPVSLRPPIPNTQSPLIGQLTHAWPSTVDNKIAAVLNQSLGAKLVGLWECVTQWRSVMSKSHRIKGGTTDEVFQEQLFPGERGASFSPESECLNFQDLQHAQGIYLKHWRTGLKDSSKAKKKKNLGWISTDLREYAALNKAELHQKTLQPNNQVSHFANAKLLAYQFPLWGGILFCLFTFFAFILGRYPSSLNILKPPLSPSHAKYSEKLHISVLLQSSSATPEV